MTSLLSEISRLAPDLFVCGALAVSERSVADRGITLVVNATRELPVCWLGHDVKVIQIPVDDNPGEDLFRHFELLCALIQHESSRGGRTLVHCVAGISRSVSLCVAFLMRHRGLSLNRALYHVKKCRPIARPNPGFLRQLAAWEMAILAGRTDAKCPQDEADMDCSNVCRAL